MKALWYRGADIGEKQTRVFAYMGIPERNKRKERLPAVVLVHGGGGYAFPEWVKIWNDRGYVALAMCNTGFYPKHGGKNDYFLSDVWTHEIKEEKFSQWTLPPDNDAMDISNKKLDQMWMFHAVWQCIVAKNVLKGLPAVDGEKIGIVGISWGAVITSITIGYDQGFAFAVPVYGSGYLNESHGWIKNNFGKEEIVHVWEPSLNLKRVHIPVLWLCWGDDHCFSINSNSKSCADTSNGILSIQMNMGHSHREGWKPEEIYRFADSVVNDGEPLTYCVTQPGKGRDISFCIHKPADTISIQARICYLTEYLSYSLNGRRKRENFASIDQEWQFAEGVVKGNEVFAHIPEEAKTYFVELKTTVKDGRSFIVDSYVYNL